MNSFKLFFLSIVILSLCACAKTDLDDVDSGPYKGMSAKQLYVEAQKSIKRGEYETAIKQLEAMETMYPFNAHAEQAELDLINAYYENGDYPSAAATAERFIHLYPRAKKVDYAYYMKGLANFQQTRGTLARILPIDDAWRDPGTQSQAYSDFASLVQQFPNSRYKANALQRMIYLRNQFAQKELNIANYYYVRKMYVAAIERANYLITTYPQAPTVQAALALVYHANKALGLQDAAEDALKVYTATYHKQPPEVEAASV